MASDAGQMCAVLNPIIEIGGTTAHRRPFDEERMTSHYIAPRLGIACHVAIIEGEIVGFQSLERADPAFEGDFVLPESWAVIATFAKVGRARSGVGSALFAATRAAARAVELEAIDATIRKENTGGQVYYEKMGFVTYNETAQTVSKAYRLRP